MQGFNIILTKHCTRQVDGKSLLQNASVTEYIMFMYL